MNSCGLSEERNEATLVGADSWMRMGVNLEEQSNIMNGFGLDDDDFVVVGRPDASGCT
jgi:hypothetical protein